MKLLALFRRNLYRGLPSDILLYFVHSDIWSMGVHIPEEKASVGDTLYIVVPCYNEEEVLRETAGRLKKKMDALRGGGQVSGMSKIVFVNDGSVDGTWGLIEQFHREDPMFSGICLSRNRGHQNALLAGLMESKDRADMIISMDADLQDDIDAIDGMLEAYYGGKDIVYGVRSSRKSDTFLKRFTAEGYYHFMRFLGVDLVFNHADYRLLSRRALEGLEQFHEVNLFLRGIIPQIGYDAAVVTYERHERYAGKSKYPLRRMLSFAFDGITSFSVRPMRVIISLGVLVFFISIAMMIYSVARKIDGQTVSGWTSLMASIWMIGGIQLLCLGVIGEYIGKIYSETKQRPRYIVKINLEDEGDGEGTSTESLS